MFFLRKTVKLLIELRQAIQPFIELKLGPKLALERNKN